MAIKKININRPETTKQEHRVFIVDDHPIIRGGLKQLINGEPDFRVCGDAGNIPQALKAIERSCPDIAVVDISLGYSSGIRLIEDLSHYHPDLSMLAYSMHDETIYAERCLKAGAKGYIMKHEPLDNVLSALRKIAEGDIHISDELSKKLFHKFFDEKPACSSPVNLLLNRELEIFQLIGKGLKIRKIADELYLGKKTIESYICRMKKKMNIMDSRELFVQAVKFVNKA